MGRESDTILIADVDCVGAGKSKCEEVGVKGFPTLKYGDPNDLQDYKGGRSFNELKKFAGTLTPPCSPAAMDLCSDDKKAKIEEFQKLTPEEREDMIKEMGEQIKKAETDFQAVVKELNNQYQEMSKKKENDVDAIKASGL